MSLWPFKKKPTQAPIAINRNFYLSVLAGPGPLPPILQLLNPQGTNGAAAGFGAPLTEGASKELLNEPLAPGAYVLTTTDKLTVLQMDVFRRDDVHAFQLPTDPLQLEAARLTGRRLARAEASEWLVNLVFKGYSPDAYLSVQFMQEIAARMATLTEGVVADPLAEVYRLPEETSVTPRIDPRIDFREVGSVRAVRTGDGVWVSTRGMIKFDQAEYEMFGLPDELVDTAANMLISAAQQTLIGLPIRPGETAFALASPLEAVAGSRGEWDGRQVVEFRDPGGSGAAQGVKAWADQVS